MVIVEKTSSPSVSIYARNQQQAYGLEGGDLVSLITLKASPLPTDKAPAPLFLVTVLDKSGSMSGSKMEMMKDTMRRLVAKLRPMDSLTMVMYDTNVSVLLPPTLMDESNAEKAIELIDSLRVGSSTNLSGGLIEGLNCIPSNLPKSTVISTLLLTDGHANYGATKAEQIIELMNHTWNKEDAPAKSAVYTFGYGSDHCSQLLKDIADAGNGMYYYIENGDRIADCFADVLGGLLSVMAQNLAITIESMDENVKIKDVLTEYSSTIISEGKKVRVSLSDIQSDESRDIPIRLVLNDTSSKGDLRLLKVSLECYDSIAEKIHTESLSLSIPRVQELTDEQKSIDIEIDGHINRVETCEILKQVKELGDKNQCEKAREIIDEQINKIKNSVSAELPLCIRLVKDLQLAKDSMKSFQQFTSEGAHRISNFSASHSRQRAAPQGYEMEFDGFTYVNDSRMTMQSLY